MKKFIMIILTATSFAQANSDESCERKNMLVSKDITYQLCKNTNQHAQLPQVKFYSEKCEIVRAKTRAQIKGYVRTTDKKNVMFSDFTELTNATLRVDFAMPLDIIKIAEFSELKLNPADAIEHGTDISYGKYNLKDAKVTTQNLPSYTFLAPTFFNQYISEVHKISSILVEPLTCTIVQAKIQALESCEEVRIDQGQYNCECTYQILNQ